MKEDTSSAVQTENRRLAAIMFTDIVGFSRQMGSNEARTLRLLEAHNQIVQHAVTTYQGNVIKTIGDAFLVDFPSVVNAVQCAQQVQARFRAHNAEKEPAEQIHIRIGIHSGDIVQKEGDVFGDGVNIASRLQGLAEPDTICLSQVVYQEVAKRIDLGTVVSLGRPQLKNITERFQVYALLPERPKGLRHILQVQRLKLSRRLGTALLLRPLLVLVLLLGGIGTARYVFLPTPNPQPPTPSLQPEQALPLPDKPSIIVLPFANMSKDPEQDYFSDGLTEILTSDLSKISSLFVIARNSAFTYKGKAVKVQEVGREMGVRYVLEGSVLKADRQVRITAQLIGATTGYHLWSERYDRALQDIFALQDEIVQKIVTTLNLQLAVWEQGAVARRTTDNLEAYDYYLRGVGYYLRLTKEANTQARQMLEKAAVLDPQYAEAYALLAGTYYIDWFFFWSHDPETPKQALELARKAVELEDSLPAAHAVLGYVYLQQKQHEKAIAEAKRAVTLDPNYALGCAILGDILFFAGRAEESIQLAKKAPGREHFLAAVSNRTRESRPSGIIGRLEET